MKRELKLVAVATAAAILAGCASGGAGGGAGSGEPETRPPVTSRCAGLALLNAGCWPGGTILATDIDWSTALPPAVPTSRPFTSWAEARGAGIDVTASGPAAVITYTGRIGSVSASADPFQSDRTVSLKYDAQGNLVYFRDLANSEVYANLSGLGHSEIDFEAIPSGLAYPQSPFTSVYAGVVGEIANPYVAGWNYQSFGVWNRQQDSSGEGGFVAANSYGAATPASAVPLTGSATFSGKLGGLYVSPTGEGSIAASDVTVNADFSARSLGFVSTNTVLTRDAATPAPAPNLNLSGTLGYAPGSNTFSGTLASAGGTMTGTSNGQFYGPKAEELGGVFVVKSSSTVETFTGAYGAKR